MSRHVAVVEPGTLRIEQRTRIARAEIGTDVSGPACVYAQVRVARGRVAYLHGDTRVVAPSRFAVLLPPFVVVQAVLERCDATSTTLVFVPPPSLALPPVALLLPETPDMPLARRAEMLERTGVVGEGIPISRERDPSDIALRAKTTLDTEYSTRLTIADVARRLDVSPARLSRTFKGAYGLPPVRYRHQIRIMDALMRLTAGAAPVDVSLDVGFEDLSRFYKVFRRMACGVPGAYRPGRSRNAKT